MNNVNLAPLLEKLPASFAFVYYDSSGSEQKTVIELELKRMNAGLALSKAFQDALKSVNENPEPLFDILPKLIGGWNVTMGDEGDFLPTDENLRILPPDFIAEVAKCVFETVVANPQKAGNSANSSAQTAKGQSAIPGSSTGTASALPVASGE